MFGIDFYPTGDELAARMLAGIELHRSMAVLEPEAGKGNLVSAVKKAYNPHDYPSRGDLDIDTIELDPDLQNVLRGAGCRVVHDDFLTFSTFKRYHLIVMNPPFSDGDRHLLKAIDLQRRGGKIRCLLNAETVRNPYTTTRKDLARKLAELGAEVEYISGAFRDAERQTGVEVALIKIEVPYTDDDSVILEGLRQAQEQEAAAAGRPPDEMMHADIIQQLVDQYNFEAKVGIAVINEYSRAKPHIMDRIGGQYQSPILYLKIGEHSRAQDVSVNGYIELLRAKFWSALFANPQFTALLTSELCKKYMQEIATLVGYEFSLFNIYTIRAQFGALAIAGIEKAIIDLFESLSHKHAWDETHNTDNIHYYDGWKTNKAWKINHKVIRPAYGLENDYHGGYRLSYHSTAIQDLMDMDKVFSYLAGRHLGESCVPRIIEAALARRQTRNIELPYFTATFFKKGTCHIKFTDLDLLHKFNIYGARNRQWLPPSYGKAAYSDMGSDERAVVDAFEGEESYAKTFTRKDYFIVSNPERLLTYEG